MSVFVRKVVRGMPLSVLFKAFSRSHNRDYGSGRRLGISLIGVNLTRSSARRDFYSNITRTASSRRAQK
ncbi:hypothetical protein OB236_18600 [Paenibacillus sp. WQ 127069]|uniref:DUF4236 domain-containing protein n=1 Tax=Paenibacillus baimaensis TaxID=2982185 RepID=A0ABT2UHJ5_9BACL|nr:hypothetical protein [Paenibacillus sp. WQ 127069]